MSQVPALPASEIERRLAMVDRGDYYIPEVDQRVRTGPGTFAIIPKPLRHAPSRGVIGKPKVSKRRLPVVGVIGERGAA